MHLDSEDDDAARTGDEVGCEQVVIAKQKTLYHKGGTANGHGDESGQGDAVGVTCTNRLDGLWQIAEDETEGGNPATNVNQKLMFHSI